MCSFVEKKLANMDSSMMSASSMWHSLNDILQQTIIQYITQKKVKSVREKPI